MGRPERRMTPSLRTLLGGLFGLWLALSVLTAQAAPVEKRVGIVIGNTHYKSSPLVNPRNDAIAMAKFMRTHGFEVSEFLDLPSGQIPQLKEVIRSKVDSNTTFVLFYAGHGMQVEGRNYLPSPDASLQSLRTLTAGSIALDELLGTLQAAKPRASIVILDACRDNPFAGEALSKEAPKGLARAVAPPGTVIFYATRPGSTASDGTGANGLFTEHLLREVKNTSLPLELVFRRVSNSVYKASRGEQEPWVEGVIREEIVLAAYTPPPATSTPTPSATSSATPSATPSAVPAPPTPPVPVAVAQSPERIAPISKREALLALAKLELGEDKSPTRYFCRDDQCEPYAQVFRQMRTTRSLPTLPLGHAAIRLCELDLTQNQCKSDFLSHGTGVSPIAVFAKMLGTSVNTREFALSEVQNSNGGGLVFSAEPQITIMRSRIGVSNDIACRPGTGRLELMPDSVELELAQNICMQTTPPVPWQYKLGLEVLLFDATTLEAIVRWRQRGVSVGLYMSSEGFAKVSFQ